GTEGSNPSLTVSMGERPNETNCITYMHNKYTEIQLDPMTCTDGKHARLPVLNLSWLLGEILAHTGMEWSGTWVGVPTLGRRAHARVERSNGARWHIQIISYSSWLTFTLMSPGAR